MRHANRRLGAVHMLPSRSARPHGLPTDVLRIEAGLFDRFQDLDSHEPVLALMLRPKRAARDPLHAAPPGSGKRLQARRSRYGNQSRAGRALRGPWLDFHDPHLEPSRHGFGPKLLKNFDHSPGALDGTLSCRNLKPYLAHRLTLYVISGRKIATISARPSLTKSSTTTAIFLYACGASS